MRRIPSKALCNGLQGAVAQYAANQTKPRTPGEPFLVLISALGYFTWVTQHAGPMALHHIQRMKRHG